MSDTPQPPDWSNTERERLRASATPFNPVEARALFEQWGFSGHVGLKYHAHGADWVELAVDWRPELTVDTDQSLLASGPVITLMDLAGGAACWTRMGEFVPLATIDLRVDYLRPSPKGARVFGFAECYHLTRRVAFVRGVAHNGDRDDPLAFVAATFIRTQAQPKAFWGGGVT